ncbi:hypothetical protein [Modestobacter sp. Leaf380]|uniref:hypothetical protein n=1 Tax=Modestobacter sp. Leaf380 TaxID=1736356 RepID=UPI0006FA2EB3|nr:hypothetical protein [Modestobacter sp. Leaf380]KQS73705.1 hypothetical protein ASG41_03675 [Modestobacter sp. Leaf380]
MDVSPLFVLLLVVGVAAGGAALLMRQFVHAEASAEQRARRHAHLISGAAVVIGLLAALAAAVAVLLPAPMDSAVGRPGVAAMMLPLAFGVAHTGVLLVGELTWPRPAGLVRRAQLRHRGVLQTAPVWLLRTGAGTAVTGIVVIAVGAVTGDRYSRSITVYAGAGSVQGSASPYVGPGYGLPALVGLGCLLAVTAAALWVVANRPAVVTDDAEQDDAFRRASAHRVLRGATSAGLVLVAGLVAVSGLAVRNAALAAAENARLADLPVGTAATLLPWVGGALAFLGLLGGAAGVGIVVVRTTGRMVEPVRADR